MTRRTIQSRGHAITFFTRDGGGSTTIHRAPAPLRIAIDADCPRCGYPERFYEPARQVLGCTKRTDPCGYESTEREA